MFITGIPTQIPQSDVIASRMKQAAFLPFPDSFKNFEQSKYAKYPHSMLEACLTDWSLGSFQKFDALLWYLSDI